MKPVLMIHEIDERVFSLPLEKYILTFDDGLYSQFYYFDRFKSIPTEKIYFISSGIICDGVQSTDFPTCREAHQKAFVGNTEDYMTVAQIKELMADPLVTIGGHSHTHNRLGSYTKLVERIKHIKDDTELMLEWFKANLGVTPTKFCFPYNDDYQGIYQSLLKIYGFTGFYGRERTPIEMLLHTQSPQHTLDI
jgi:hypothetical protein